MADACCKLGVAVDTYDLPVPADAEAVDDYLASRWTGADGREAVGYRALTDWFNERLLRTVYLSHDRSATEPRIESEYEALAGDDDFRRSAVIDDLERDGIDGEALADALVSRSTMSRHLTDCLGVEKEPGPSRSGEWELEKIEHGRRVFGESVESAVSSLANADRLPGGADAEVELPVMLSCPSCATRVSLQAALSRGYVCSDHLGGPPAGDARPDRDDAGDDERPG